MQFNCASIGRPRLLTGRDDRLIARKIRESTTDNAKALVRDIADLNVSAQTVRRSLKRQGFLATPKKKKPFLSKRHKKLRLEFAEAYQYWTISDWRKVIFSDESKVNRFWSDGRKWSWSRPDDALNDRNVTGTVKYGGGSVMVWGCITALGPGYLTKIEGSLDAKLYCNILQDEFLRSCQYYNLETNDIIFQQDNDPKHTIKLASKWLQDNEITTLSWPLQSPDMNPIEHTWALLKYRLNQYQNLPSGMVELWERIATTWNEISKQECLNIIDSMPDRIRALIKAKGGYTKY